MTEVATANVVVRCVHCSRLTLMALQTRPKKFVTPPDHASGCIMLRQYQRNQATYQEVIGSPTYQWEDYQDYPYFEYGIARPERSA